MEKWKELEEYIALNYEEPIVLASSYMEKPKRRGIKLFKKKSSDFNLECMSATSMEDSLNDVLDSIQSESFHSMLFRLIDESGKKDSEIYQASMIDKRLFSKIRSNPEYHPSRETAIQLVFGLKLEIDRALDFLQTAGYALSFSKKDDVLIRYFLERKEYDLITVNQALYDFDLPLLFK